MADIAANDHDAITDGPFGSSLKSDHYTPAGIRVIRLGNIGSRRFISDDEAFVDESRFQALRRHEACEGDLVTAALGEPLGRTAKVPPEYGPAIVKADCFRLRPSARVEKDLILYWLNSPAVLRYFLDRSQGIGRVRINLGTFRNTTLPIPPLAEQRRIVTKLDGLTTHIARARAELFRASHLASRLREQTLSNAVSGDLTRDFRAGADTSWPKKTLEQIGTVITGSTPPTVERDRLFGGTHAFFKPTDLDAGYHVAVPRETLTEEGFRRSRGVPAGSTLVTCIGATISKTGFARVACAFNQQINAIVPKENTIPEWLFWAVSSPSFRSKIINNSSATTMPIINKSRFQQLTLAVPPTAEQREIVIRIEAAFARADRLEAEAAHAATLLDRLESSILARAFRGELVSHDPADEPASVLLDRIRAERVAAPKPKRGRHATAASM